MDCLFAGHLQSWAKLLKSSSKTVDFTDFINLTVTFTVAVKRPKTAKPDGLGVFNPSDFSLSAAGRLSIDVTHYRLFLSAPLHIIATVSKRAIYPCATGSKSAQVVAIVTDRISKSAVLSGVKVFSKCL